jgi:hypothetical protein
MAAEELTSSDMALARRAAQPVSAREREQALAGPERLWNDRSERVGLSAAIRCDRQAAREALFALRRR